MERTEQPERPQDPQLESQPQQPDSEPQYEPNGESYDQEHDESSEQDKWKDRRATAWEIVETILLALLIFLMVRAVVINFRVDGNSMEPTLSHAEMLVINRRAYTSFDLNAVLDALPLVDRQGEDRRYIFNPPQRGDIVVFEPPGSSSDPYIKRIIGLPGESVEIRDGMVIIDDQPLAENYTSGSTSWRGSGTDDSALVIPEEEYFVLGDNRDNSSDSRSFGTVSKDAIIGKSWIAYWPPGEMQIFPTPAYGMD